MKRGVFLDLDGTIWNAAKPITQSWNQTLEKAGVPIVLTEATMESVMGMAMDEIADLLFAGYDKEKRMELLHLCEQDENEAVARLGGVLYPGLEDALRKLKEEGYVLAVISNCQSGYIEAFYQAHGLGHYFDDKASFGDTLVPKWRNIQAVAQNHDLDQVIYIGDIQKDADATHQAGAAFLFASWGLGDVKDEVTARSWQEVPALVGQMFEDLEKQASQEQE